MSDLTATNCGCNNNTTFSNNGCCSIIWLIILFSICGNNDGCGCGSGFGLFNNRSDCDNECNNSWIWIIILLFFCCGNNNSCC